jgi:DNA repair protein RecO (recombination protein O)
MICRTEALALRVSPYSRTSHVVSWFTRDFGRISTLVKGAQRPRSMFLGQYDLFYTCDLLFYARDRGGLRIIRECSPLRPRSALREDWRAAAAASYVADVVWRTSPEGTVNAALFALATDTLDALTRRGASPDLLFWFETRLAGLLGVGPKLGACAGCGDALSGPSSEPALFSCGRGVLLCSRCGSVARPEHPGREDPRAVVRLDRDSLARLRRWQNSPLPAVARPSVEPPPEQLDIRRLLGVFFEQHLDINLSARRVALALVSSRPDSRGGNTGDDDA